MGEVASLDWGKNQSSVFLLTQANLSLSALNCFMYPDCHFWIMFKCINAKCISYVTSTAFEKRCQKKTIPWTWQFSKNWQWTSVVKYEWELLFGKIHPITLLFLFPARLTAVCGEEIKAADRQLMGVWIIGVLTKFLNVKALAARFCPRLLSAALYEQLSVV